MLDIERTYADGLDVCFEGWYAGKRSRLSYNTTTHRWFWSNEGGTELTRSEIKHRVIPELEKHLP